MSRRAPAWPGTDPGTIGWTVEPVGDGPPEVPHCPSKMAREGLNHNSVPNLDIEDRGDGGGGVGLFPSSGPSKGG
jgi:hypothetical protein